MQLLEKKRTRQIKTSSHEAYFKEIAKILAAHHCCPTCERNWQSEAERQHALTVVNNEMQVGHTINWPCRPNPILLGHHA